eukprot:855015-Rhodomonas_salina.2
MSHGGTYIVCVSALCVLVSAVRWPRNSVPMVRVRAGRWASILSVHAAPILSVDKAEQPLSYTRLVSTPISPHNFTARPD